MVFVNGILQEYSSDKNEKKSGMQVFTADEKSGYECELYVNNIKLPENAEISVLSFVNITEPYISPSPENFRGVFHSGSAGLPISLHMGSEAEKADLKIETEYENHPVSASEKERFILNENNRGCNFILDDFGSTEQPLYVFGASEDGTLDLTLYSYCFDWFDTEYMISFYKNHERIKFNEGSDYIKMKMKSGYMNTVPVKLENICEGDFIYCIAAPVSSFETTVIKSFTFPVINRNNLPERIRSEWYLLDPEDIETVTAEDTENEDEDFIGEYVPEGYADIIADNPEAATGWVLIEN